jgi:hypothetical protein
VKKLEAYGIVYGLRLEEEGEEAPECFVEEYSPASHPDLYCEKCKDQLFPFERVICDKCHIRELARQVSRLERMISKYERELGNNPAGGIDEKPLRRADLPGRSRSKRPAALHG